MCSHASTCPDRIAYGDMPNGCTKQDQRQCVTATELDASYWLVHITKSINKPGEGNNE